MKTKLCRKTLKTRLHKVVEVCVEVVETLWIKGLAEMVLQDAGGADDILARSRFYVLPKIQKGEV